jgi:hypothetical protein
MWPWVRITLLRKINAVDIDCFKHELASSVLCYDELKEHSVSEDLDRFVNFCNTTLSSMIDKHALRTTKTVKAIDLMSLGIVMTLRQRRENGKKQNGLGEKEKLKMTYYCSKG